MKLNIKILSLLLVGVLSTSLFATVTGVQFGGSDRGVGATGLIFYTDDFGMAGGFSLGYTSNDSTNKTQKTGVGAFLRKNTKVTAKGYLGLGLDLATVFGQDEGVDIDKDFRVSPYMIYDYHLSDRFLINAGANIFSYIVQEKNNVKTTTTSTLGSFINITYLLK